MFRTLVSFFFVASHCLATEPAQSSRGRGDAQIKSLEALAQKRPHDKFINLKLADIYYKKKNWDKALAYYKIANTNLNVAALEGIVKCLDKKKDYLELVRALEILKQEKPMVPKYSAQLADAYVKQGSLDKAIENYKNAIKLAPKFDHPYEGLLQLHEKNKNFYEAAIVAKDAIRTMGDPKNIFISKLCKYKYSENYYEDSKIICQDAIARAPKIPDNHVYLGLSYKYTGNENQARKIIISSGKKFKQSEFAQFYAGQASDESRNWEQAVIFYRQGTISDPNQARCFLGLAKAHYELRQYQPSIEAFVKACELDNSVDNEMKRISGLLRAKNENAWYAKFRSQADRCPVLRDLKEAKKSTK